MGIAALLVIGAGHPKNRLQSAARLKSSVLGVCVVSRRVLVKDGRSASSARFSSIVVMLDAVADASPPPHARGLP